MFVSPIFYFEKRITVWNEHIGTNTGVEGEEKGHTNPTSSLRNKGKSHDDKTRFSPLHKKSKGRTFQTLNSSSLIVGDKFSDRICN